MAKLPIDRRFWLIVPVLLVAVLFASTGMGAPSVRRDATPTPASSSALAAPTLESTATGAAPAQPTSTPQPEAPTPTVAPTQEPTAAPEPTSANGEPTARPEAPPPTDPGMSEVYQSGQSGRPEIALTFDAGADRGYAEQILDTLKQYGIVASFGITGHWASENPDLVRRMVDEGHQVFNHTWSHESLTGYSTGEGTGITDSADRAEELNSTNDEIAQDAGGYDTRPYWRPPYGDIDAGVLADAAANGYTITVMWSCDTLGWDGYSVDQILERCVDPATAGDIILMHVGNGSQDAAALPQMIEQLEAAGFSFVTIEQLLQP
mgnify:CR=1 FL=1